MRAAACAKPVLDSSDQASVLEGLTPPLKWAGGKRWLLDRLETLWMPHQHRRLVEPFCGGLAVALGLKPASALLNDQNPHVIHFYRHLQRGFTIKKSLKHEEAFYYQARERFNHLITSNKAHTAEAAGWFYYLNRTGYNGLCRFNRQGRFNVPFGRYKTINYRTDFTAYQPMLDPWVFSTGDFESITLQAQDWVYADPPYDQSFTAYSQEGFGWPDQERLAHWLAAHSGPVIASNLATDRIVALYEGLGFDIHFVQGPRLIACSGNRQSVRELLALKNV